MSEKIYLALLHKIGLTHKMLFRIFEVEHNFKNFYDTISYSKLKQYKLSDKKIESIIELKKTTSLAKIQEKITQLDIQIILHTEPQYPKNIANTFNPPFLLYLRGNFVSTSISFIGSRNISAYGRKVIEALVPKVGNYFSIVSGGAMGCDAYAHKIALDNNIPTLSIFGTGVDIFYPSSSCAIFEEILQKGGGLLSSFPLGTGASAFTFPIRNELVAGLSEGVVVIEAAEKSGSLITAGLALELGKDLFSVPGEIFKKGSEGCNALIEKGEAYPVTSSKSILQQYNISSKKTTKEIPKFACEIESNIYTLLLVEPLSGDEIAKRLDTDISTVLLKIAMLELGMYIRKGENASYEII